VIQNFRRKAFTMSKKSKDELADRARAKTQYRRDNMQIVIDMIRSNRDGTNGKREDKTEEQGLVDSVKEKED